jgi:hypothetical protein
MGDYRLVSSGSRLGLGPERALIEDYGEMLLADGKETREAIEEARWAGTALACEPDHSVANDAGVLGLLQGPGAAADGHAPA